MNRVKSYKQPINEKRNISSLEHVTFLRGFVMWEKKSITEHKNISFVWKRLGFTFSNLTVGVTFHIGVNIYQTVDPASLRKNYVCKSTQKVLYITVMREPFV